MPVLHAGRNIDAVPRLHLDCRLAPFLIIASACHTDQDLSAAPIRVMDMPVVPASRLKGHVENAHLPGRYRGKIALPNKVFCEGIIRRSNLE